ncbi:lysylphosphatidylglycerol synthase transmembrane domain-containing protein [Schlesneria paludicola]|uniref:lysylphosphatidylglycerol synthase transmembrane domain-containing protein n=1 Tax=Schlesneria paludicola TaxID=360056 RepID=UPI000492519A|nr:lysylphosphatidylglycerol synthase transmembrane domain-containing protein [Schlesneria paludicola]
MNEASPPAIRRVRIWHLIKLLLFCVVVMFVLQRAFQIWKTAPSTQVEIHAIWLVPASLTYLLSWLPSVWFWMALLKRTRQPIDFWTALRAYYVGHLGKYVPGKALVLVIRGTMVKDVGVDPLLAGLMVVYETLVFMAAGTALGIATAPWVFGEAFWSRLPESLRWLSGYPVLSVAAVFTAIFATTPFSAWIFTNLGRKTVPTATNGIEIPAISAWLVCQGVVATTFGWLLHAVSLGFVLQSVSRQPLEWSQFPIWLAATTCSMVGGFLVIIAPGGIGVREGVLIEILQRQAQIGPATAVLAAVLVRAVSFGSEVVAAAVLYVAHRRAIQRRLARESSQS